MDGMNRMNQIAKTAGAVVVAFWILSILLVPSISAC